MEQTLFSFNGYRIMSQQTFAGIQFGDSTQQNIFEIRRQTLCQKWVSHDFETSEVKFQFLQNLVGDFQVKGQYKDIYALNGRLHWWAANPPTFSQSFTGSGLPYPNESIAFESSPNDGYCSLTNGTFQFMMSYPNSYYKNLGSMLVPPQVHIQLVDTNDSPLSPEQIIPLGNGIPFRSLTFPRQRKWSQGPMFYWNPNLTVRNQEQILRENAYPNMNETPKNFWGTKPPN